MKIYSMTATFGKLSHETLRLEPGLNIIHRPNEWGKSTWCAFLTAMLYGIDTRQQSTKTALADKDRYAPWSGEPMSGRMEICWNGKDITIERSTKGRVPMGEFRAYETDTGLDVPELTAANCGLQLLGVERAVFTQAGFIRLQDMPVVQNESLRRRLNNLVTTGDENSAGDALGQQLKDLKNKVRHNKTGLLPQAELERDQLRSQLQQQEELRIQSQQIQQRQSQLEEQIRLLENHGDALRYQAAKQGVEKIRIAEETCSRLETELSAMEGSCSKLPQPDIAGQMVQKGQALFQEQKELAATTQLPPAPIQPDAPISFQNTPPEQAIAQAQQDSNQYRNWEAAGKKQHMLPMIAGLVAMGLILLLVVLCTAAGLNPILLYIGGPVLLLLGGLGIALSVGSNTQLRSNMQALAEKYPGIPEEQWISHAQQYADAQQAYRQARDEYDHLCHQASQKEAAYRERVLQYAGTQSLEETVSYWESVMQQHTDLSVKRRELQNATETLQTLRSVATTAPEPAFPTTLSLSQADTDAQLQASRFEQRNLQIKLGQCMGQATTLGQEDVLKARLTAVTRRINRLEEYYKALELAQDVLYQATTALQRRFAPRISKKAQNLFATLTGGRYQKISLSDDFRISASAENEDTLRSADRRSDGTVDQLYLSLRLAVASEVTPDAPLVLDDALVRFDEKRLKNALEVLKEESETKQVIVFSCQSREQDLL